MQERIESLELRLKMLEARVGELARQVGAGAAAVHVPPSGSTTPEPAEAPAVVPIHRGLEDQLARHDLVLLAGLVSFVLAGAMALRIVAVSQVLPLAVGGVLGVAYCGALLVVAELKFRRGSALHGDTFAILAVFILDALLVELTHRKGGFARPAAYAVEGASLLALALVTLVKARSVPFAVALLAAPATGIAIGGSPFLHPYFAGILACAIVTGQVGMGWRRWSWARWGPAVFCVLYILVLSILARLAARSDLPKHAYARPAFALPIIGCFFALYVLPAAAAAVARARPLDRFEITLAVGMAVVAFGGVANILLVLPSGPTVAGVVGLAVSALFYGTAVASFVRHGAESPAFYALSAIAGIYVFAGLAPLISSGPALGAAWMAHGFALAFFAARLGKRTLAIHTILVTLVAFFVTSLGSVELSPPAGALRARLADGRWLFLAGALAVGSFGRLRTFRRTGEVVSARRARFRSTAQTLVLASGVILLLAGALPHAFAAARLILGVRDVPATADPLWLTVETMLLLGGALAALAMGVRLRLDGAVLLAVALMAVGGLKLFAFDAMRVPGGHFIFSACALGVALILSSFLYRRYRGLRQGEGRAPGDVAPPSGAAG